MKAVTRAGRAHTRVLAGALALTTVVAVTLLAMPVSSSATAGSAGTDTSLPATDSRLTVHGRGRFADLAITVNQTKHLLNQAISVTWTGGTETSSGNGGRFASNYLQLMQCWGDDDGTIADNPGPPPEQCVDGATEAVYGGTGSGLFPSASFAAERIISRSTWPNFDPTKGVFDPRSTFVWKPFRAVDGTLVGIHKDPNFNPSVEGGQYWLDPYFNIVTTNEIAGGRTGQGGKGAELMEVNTGVESSGLGCGQSVQPLPGGGTKVPKCWLVIVPRGDPIDEDQGTPFARAPDQFGVMTSPLAPSAWQHRIAVPLEFNPVDSPCQLAAEQRRISGTELAGAAVSSWQPKLCAEPGLEPYAYGTVGESLARSQLVSGAPGSPGMVVVARPLDPATVDPANPVVYAPLTASGLVVGFNVERVPSLTAEPAEVALSGIRVAHINLTPRLLAKLLTQSYASEVTIKASPPYDWLKANPSDLGGDPDFLRYNPEFTQLHIGASKNFGGLVAPAGNTDAARQVWEYVLADPEARAWLDGAPDQWGMKVNPVYATTAAANSTGGPFASSPPESFPKSDPFCYKAPTLSNGVMPPPLCGTDWLPYAGGFKSAAQETRQADDASRTVDNPFAQSTDQAYLRSVPQILGTRTILSLTDTASAFEYGVQEASLSRAGDDVDGRTFVAPDATGLTAGLAAMVPSSTDPAFLHSDPTIHAPGAYPLTFLTYAATTPLSLDTTARRQYAAFLDYAATEGQVSGQLLGQLPLGYVPLPPGLQKQATVAAATIRDLQPAPAPPEPVPAQAPRASTPSRKASSSPVAAVGPPTSAEPLSALASAPSAPPPATAAASPTANATRPMTPIVAMPATRYVVPSLAGLALLALLGVLEITKRPRRATAPVTSRPEERTS